MYRGKDPAYREKTRREYRVMDTNILENVTAASCNKIQEYGFGTKKTKL